MKVKTKEHLYLIPKYDNFISENGVSIYGLIHDDVAVPETVERHFNDLYKLYLRKLSDFEMNSSFDNQSVAELQGILNELIELKKSLVETPE